MQTLRPRSLRRLPITFGWLTKRPIPDAVLDGYLAPATQDPAVRRDLTKLLRGISPRATLAAAERLPSFRGPVLLAWAPEDRFFPLAHARRLAALFPDARVVEIPDAWALVPEDQPALLARHIDAFLSDEPSENERAALAMRGGAFDWLGDEPDLYGPDDGEQTSPRLDRRHHAARRR